MRRTFSDRVERSRVLSGRLASSRGDDYGAFELKFNGPPASNLFAIVSAGDESMRWEHVSVSNRGRCPTWSEMQWVKTLFWGDEEPVMQLHPRLSQYVSFHPYCLHLWRPLDVAIPEPPTIAVGPQGITLSDLRMVPR